jgi:hypothetical protein
MTLNPFHIVLPPFEYRVELLRFARRHPSRKRSIDTLADPLREFKRPGIFRALSLGEILRRFFLPA